MYILITINLQIEIFFNQISAALRFIVKLTKKREMCNLYENLYDEKKREY